MDHGRILEIIERAAAEGWTSLDLSENELRGLPHNRNRDGSNRRISNFIRQLYARVAKIWIKATSQYRER